MAAQKYWFKARGKHSVGWAPTSWQAWVVLAFYVGFLAHSFFLINSQSETLTDTFIAFLPRFLLFTALLTIITYLKGEPTTWHHEDEKKPQLQPTENKNAVHSSEAPHKKED